MSTYETLSVVVSCLAAIIAIVVWIGQRRLAKESLELQRATANLAKKQLEILNREEESQGRPILSVDLLKVERSYRFQVTNIGDATAHDVSIKLLLENPKDDPIVASEYKDKLPVRSLGPGGNFSLIAALHLGSPTGYNILLTWKDPNGEAAVLETYASL